MSSDEAGTAHSARDAALAALGVADGPLTIGGLDAEALAREFGTPLYVYDAGAFLRAYRARARGLRRLRSPFALKANPSLALARVAHASGIGAEALRVGRRDPARGARGLRGRGNAGGRPRESARDLREALRVRATINLESEGEDRRLVPLARELAAHPRVHTRSSERGAGRRTPAHGGQLEPLRRRSGARRRLRARDRTRGQLHLARPARLRGSQAFDVAAWLDACENLARLGDDRSNSRWVARSRRSPTAAASAGRSTTATRASTSPAPDADCAHSARRAATRGSP